MLRFRYTTLAGELRLPASDAWELVPAVPGGSLAIGDSWQDSVVRVDSLAGFLQSWQGTVRSEVVGDTLIEGRRFWRIRERGRLRYEERSQLDAYGLGAVVTRTRHAEGERFGTYWWDPVDRLPLMRADSITLQGQVMEVWPDGRAHAGPARFEAVSRWERLTPTQHAARVQAAREAAARGPNFVVEYLEPGSLEARLASRDVALRDSVLDAWVRSADASHRQELWRLLEYAARWDRAWSRAADSVRGAAGDTLHLLRSVAAGAGRDQPLRGADVEFLMPFLGDHGRLLALNERPGELHGLIATAFLRAPPAIQPDTASWPCTSTGCAALAAQWPRADAPELADLGLLVRALTDPRQWADALAERAATRRGFLATAAARLGGIRWSTSAGELGPSIPQPGAGWERWRDWLQGTPGPVRRAGLATAGELLHLDPDPPGTLRLVERRTGRDIVGELRALLAATPGDSARLALGTMLIELDALEFRDDEILGDLRDQSSLRRTLAVRAMLQRLAGTRPPDQGSADLDRLYDQLIRIGMFGEAALLSIEEWRPGVADPAPEGGQPRAAHLLEAGSLPATVRERWRGRVPFRDTLTVTDPRQAAVVILVRDLVAVGPFVRVTLAQAGQLARPADGTPHMYLASTTYYLARFGNQWVIVTRDASIT